MAAASKSVSIEMLKPMDLKVDRENYQRPLAERQVAKIVKEFNPAELGVIEVSLRANGDYYVINGQHRCAALMRMGWENREVPCLVYCYLSLAEEAEIFNAQTKARKIHPVDLFRSQCFAGDKKAIAVNEVVKKHGYRVVTNGQADCIQCPGKLYDIYEQGGVERLDDVLSIVSQIYTDDRHSVPAAIIGGVNAFIERYGKSYDRARFIDIISSIPKGKVDSTALAMRAFINDKGDVLYGRAFLHFYNGKMRGSRLLPDWEALKSGPRGAARDGTEPVPMPDVQKKSA